MVERSLEDRRRALDDLERRMVQSEPLSDTRRGRDLVFGSGNPAAALVLIGEAPGAQEDRTGRPFVGPAGKILSDALADAGLDRQQIWITNAVKFRPTTEGIEGRVRNRAPTPQEIALFRPWLKDELQIVAPSVIVCLGATAAVAVLGRPVRITSERGIWVPGPHGIDTLPTFHPAFLLRRTSDRDLRFTEFVGDLTMAAERA